MTTDRSPSSSAPDRLIGLDGAFNLRDLGGYPARDGRVVRWRRVLRADGPERLTAADRTRLTALEIATIIDLRDPYEGGPGEWPLATDGVRYSLPIFDIGPQGGTREPTVTARDLGERYVFRLETAASRIIAGLEKIAERAERPVLFHCAAGKDRTGILAAALLQLLGVPDETIVTDYALSDAPHRRKIAYVADDRRSFDADYDSFPDILKGADAEVMVIFLNAVAERHGSVAQFLLDSGLSPNVVDGLRSKLLE